MNSCIVVVSVYTHSYMDTEMTATFTTHYHTDEQPEWRLDSNEALQAHREPENMRTEFMGEYSLLQSPEVDTIIIIWHM